MEEKLRFVMQYDSGEYTMSELRQRYGISRETGYVMLRRYRATGITGLVERSRAAHRQQDQTPEEIEQMALELRQAHMRFSILLSYWQH
jgi:transposase-like protein